MSKPESALISEARRVARLQARIARLKRELKEAYGELTQAKKNLRGLASSMTRDPFDQLPPIRGLDA
jgi:hypothetical protein